MTGIDIKNIADKAIGDVGKVHKFAPIIRTVLAAIPGSGPYLVLADALDRAVDAEIKAHPGSVSDALKALTDHITPGAPNSPVLGPV